jgi:hypothetical protein
MRQEDLMTAAEAGKLFGVSARTIGRRAEAGELPYIRKLPGPNGDYLFDGAQIRRLAAELEAEAGRIRAAAS